MTRLAHAGAEMGLNEPWMPGLIIDQGGSNPVTLDTTTPRSGVNAWKADTGAGNVSSSIVTNYTITTGNVYFFRVYLNFSDLPSSATQVMVLGGNSWVSIKLTPGGKFQFWDDLNGVKIGSDSALTISTGIYYCLEISVTASAGNQISAGEGRVNGTTIATISGLSSTSANTAFVAGWFNTGLVGANKVMFIDDLAMNDNTGASNNSWCGEGKVVLAKPISDNARGAWVAGAAGVTNLWDAVDNTPPVGVADGSATNTSQIKNKSTTNPTSCDLNLATYTTIGVGASDTVNAIIIWANHGEDPATGTKVGSVSMVSNPAITAVSFNFGNDAGLQGTYPGNWFWTNALINAPTVTLGTSPVIRITCTSGATGTRAASCDFLGAYVDYTPFVVPPTSLPPDLITARRTPRRRVLQRM